MTRRRRVATMCASVLVSGFDRCRDRTGRKAAPDVIFGFGDGTLHAFQNDTLVWGTPHGIFAFSSHSHTRHCLDFQETDLTGSSAMIEANPFCLKPSNWRDVPLDD